MAYPAILVASAFLLAAFAVERLARTLGFPSVIATVLVGILAKPILTSLGFTLDGLETAVPIVGTLGLVLIVLEGALDIELRRDRLRTMAGAVFMAGAGFVVCLAAFALAASLALSLSLFQAVLVAVPFAVISSAVAIPSSNFLPSAGREFVVYESSLSDIVGILVFFALLNSDGSAMGFVGGLLGGGILSLLLAVIGAVALLLVLMRIDGHIRFIPLLAGLFGLYAGGKLLHLSPLIMVLLFGLVLNNPTIITRFRPFHGWMDESYEATLNEFKILVLELTFAVRGFFFILLGYWTHLEDVISMRAWLAAGLILSVIYASRYCMLKIGNVHLTQALTWIAPRGLITVLLFLSAREAVQLPAYLEGVVVLVVLISAGLIAVARLHVPKDVGTGLGHDVVKAREN